MQFIEHTIGNLVVRQRKNDGYINATKLTRAYNDKTGSKKTPGKWFENDRSNIYIELLSDKNGLNVSELVERRGEGRNQQIWIHTKLAISFARWLSVDFEMMVDEWVETWIVTGKEPTTPSSTNELHPYQRVWYQRLMLFEKNTKLPSGHWCIFEEIGKLMRDLEAKNVHLYDRATIDISVGLAWCHWLRSQGYDTNFEKYIHHYPDKRGEQLANIYPFELLGKFHSWLQETYVPDKFPSYVREFSTPEECQLISEAIGHEVKPKKKTLKPSKDKGGRQKNSGDKGKGKQ